MPFFPALNFNQSLQSLFYTEIIDPIQEKNSPIKKKFHVQSKEILPLIFPTTSAAGSDRHIRNISFMSTAETCQYQLLIYYIF